MGKFFEKCCMEGTIGKILSILGLGLKPSSIAKWCKTSISHLQDVLPKPTGNLVQTVETDVVIIVVIAGNFCDLFRQNSAADIWLWLAFGTRAKFWYIHSHQYHVQCSVLTFHSFTGTISSFGKEKSAREAWRSFPEVTSAFSTWPIIHILCSHYQMWHHFKLLESFCVVIYSNTSNLDLELVNKA